MKAKKAAALLMAIMMTAGCAAAMSSKTADFTVELEENPTTGYRWSYTAEPADILIETGDEYIAPNKTGMVGASGMRVFTFEPQKDGEVTLSFGYLRSWENNPPVKTRVITGVVKDGVFEVVSDTTEEMTYSDNARHNHIYLGVQELSQPVRGSQTGSRF